MSNYIYSADPGLLIGFHGCEEAVCLAIINGEKDQKFSNNNWDWLGDGMYFWQNNYDRAWDYANNPPGGVKIQKPAVLGAVFSLGNCLDLTDKRHLDIVKASYDVVAASFNTENKELPKNSNPKGNPNSMDNVIRELDCAVIKNVHSLRTELNLSPYESVRALFPEGNALYQGAGFREKTHIQIAIRNPNLIRGYFLPRKEVAWTGAPPAPIAAAPTPTIPIVPTIPDLSNLVVFGGGPTKWG